MPQHLFMEEQMNAATRSSKPCFRGRRLRALIVAAVLGASVQSSPAVAVDAWQAYTFWGTPTVVGSKGFKKLDDDIEQASAGEIKIKFNLGGTLGINATNINSAVSDDIVQIADDAFYQGTVPIATLPLLPLLVQNIDEMGKVMELVWPLAERDYAKKGVTALGYYVYPPQVFWFRGNVSSLAEIKGRKVRITSAEQGAMVKSFGGIPVQLTSAEVPAALERGVVDGILTASAGGVMAWKELLKSSYMMGINYHVSYIVANTGRFMKLPPAIQSKIRDLARRHLADQTAELQREDVELRKRFASEGIVMTAAKPDEMAQAEKMSKEIWLQWAKGHGQEATQTLEQVRKGLRR